MSVNATKWVWDQEDIGGAEKLVLLRLADHADPVGGSIHPGIASVAQFTGLSERQVKRYLRTLLDRGAIAIEANEHGGRGRMTTYCIPALKGDTDDTVSTAQRVTPTVIKGDMEGTERVTPTVIKGDMEGTPLKDEPYLTVIEPPRTVNAHARRETIEDRFNRWYAVYPKHVGKQKALNVWRRLKPDAALTDAMIAAVENQKLCRAWLEQDGKFIPHPATWLHQGRWDDEPDGPPLAANDGYIAAIGDGNIAKLAEWLTGLSETFGGAAWVRSSLRRLAADVPGLSPPQVKSGIQLGYERTESSLSIRDRPVANPPALAYAIFREALTEQREVRS